jgi:diaminopimelate epimerase
MKYRFSKMHGLGNDFVVIDGIRQSIVLTPARIRFLADRHFGIGCDQLLRSNAPSAPMPISVTASSMPTAAKLNSAATARVASCVSSTNRD